MKLADVMSQLRNIIFPENWRQQSEDSKQASIGAIKEQEEATEAYAKAITSWKTLLPKLLKLGVAKEQARTLSAIIVLYRILLDGKLSSHS